MSIDGGGIRGLISVLILKEIESQLKPGLALSDCFDVIAGTSTGGIIALLLTIPGENGKPKYTANDIVEIYERFGRDVFKSSLFQFIRSGGGLWDSKYSACKLERYFHTYFGDKKLRDSLVHVIIPAYEVECDKVIFFKSFYAKKSENYDCVIKDLARATSAAPVYFRPATLVNEAGHSYTFLDGGVAVNNPTLEACIHAKEIFGEDIDYLVVSLGTGTNYGAKTKHIKKENILSAGLLGWGHKIVSLMMYAVNEATDYEMIYQFNKNKLQKKYHRFQPILEGEHMAMDRVSESNIEALKEYAKKIIEKRKSEIIEIADDLNQNMNGKNVVKESRI